MTPRIDSFEVGAVEGWGHAFCGKKFIELYHIQEDGECGIFLPGETEPKEIATDYKRNGYGGRQTFFRCPVCNQRVRYLYQVSAGLLCRKCANLNYRSQQETRSGSMYYYDKGIALVEKHLDRWPRVRPDGFSFCTWIPERPRYMHQTTYRRYLLRFLRYRKKHQERELQDMIRLLKMFK